MLLTFSETAKNKNNFGYSILHEKIGLVVCLIVDMVLYTMRATLYTAHLTCISLGRSMSAPFTCQS